MTVKEKQKQFEIIYKGTYEDILKYIVCHSSNIADVNDILQETYLEFYRILERKNVSEEKIGAFLKGIAKNKIKKHYGRFYKIRTYSLFFKNEQEIEWIETVEDDFDTLNFVINKELSKQVWEYIKKKKPLITKVFFLYYGLDLTIKEIANELNLSESKVKNILYRTLKELRDTFGKENE